MAVSLYTHQLEAVNKLKTGSILVGGVGTGKSRTALGYFFKQNGGSFEPNYRPMKEPVKDLYIITTARKRDTFEWDDELSIFLMSQNPDTNAYKNKVVIDSWNKINSYTNVKNAFFIFDEQRVVGNGSWAKSFINISKNNDWILLSATPGDTWSDYIPVFIANGFYKTATEFKRKHIVYSPYVTKYPKIDHYINCGELIAHRNDILVHMKYEKKTIPHKLIVKCEYDKSLYVNSLKEKWNPFKNEPCQDASSICSVLRKIVNTDKSRVDHVYDIYLKHEKCIVFYNYDYELDILRAFCSDANIIFSEWNGHKHESIPKSDKWLYLVQYTAGCEGWNCIETDCIIFYSQTYSYKQWEQAGGRIDRLNTPFTDLYYYHLQSSSSIDNAISNILANKRDFNESSFISNFK